MSNNLTQKPEWKTLKKLSQDIKKTHLNDLFQHDKKRFETFSITLNGLFFDYSKQRITSDILDNLISLAQSCNVEQKRDNMFDGAEINITEKRSVLHTALRRPKSKPLIINNQNVTEDVHKTLQRMKSLSEDVRAGKYLGATGQTITQIVSIGIGGSDFGPHLVCKALENDSKNLEIYFVSNIDAHDITKALNQCNPETTLFVIISKSFQTQDTIANANTAKEWMIKNLPDQSDIGKHFIAVSANKISATQFGIQEDNFFPIWDWVNGRFSLWSAVGLPICFKLGFDVFEALLNGAYKIDQHFCDAPLKENIPVLMALIGIWNRNFLGAQTHAILPYSQNLFFLPAYIRQLDMESNGKTIDIDGNKIDDYQTGPVIFGEAGTNGQHSFYQHLHQGSDLIASDFIGIIHHKHQLDAHHHLLLSHMLSQSQALMQGKQDSDDPHRYFNGNKPSSTLLLNRLDAYHLGMLIALYEHKIFVQGVIWNINSFDQFGVELGKELSQKIENNDLTGADNSTRGLFSLIHKSKKEG